MDKVIQEFRIIETDDGFRIEIKGDKEQLRDFVMSLDPRHWMHHGPGWRFPGGPPPGPWGPRHHGHGHEHRGRRWRFEFAPPWFGFGGWCDEDEEEAEEKHAPPPKEKRTGDTV